MLSPCKPCSTVLWRRVIERALPISAVQRVLTKHLCGDTLDKNEGNTILCVEMLHFTRRSQASKVIRCMQGTGALV